MKKAFIFMPLLGSLLLQTGCGPEDLYPQFSGTFTLVAEPSYSNENIKGDPNKMARVLKVSDKMVYGGGTFSHILQFDAQKGFNPKDIKNSQVTGKFAEKLFYLTSLGSSYPEYSPSGKTLLVEFQDRSPWCYLDYYVSVFMPDHLNSPSPYNLMSVYVDYEFVYDGEGNVVLDEAGRPLQSRKGFEEIKQESPVNQESFDKFFSELDEKDGARLSLIVSSRIDSDMSDCGQDGFVTDYQSGEMALSYSAARDNLDLSTDPLVEDNSNPLDINEKPYQAFDVLTAAMRLKKDDSSNRSKEPESGARSSLTSDDEIREHFKKRLMSDLLYREKFGEENYRKKVEPLAYQACTYQSCPEIVVTVPSVQGTDAETYVARFQRTKNDSLKLLSVEQRNLKGIRVVPIAEDSEFEINGIRAVGVINTGDKGLGGTLSAPRKANQGLILSAVKAVQEKLASTSL